MKTEIHLTLPDGSVLAIDGHVVAHDRATYYSSRDADTTYTDEYEFTITDDYELEDWAVNQMNWDDVKGTSRLVSPAPPADWDIIWRTCEKRVVRVPD
jgi:hypothetical protein